MIERDTQDRFIRVRCDDCGKPAPPVEDLIINQGLIGMGWICSGGSHICPNCKEPE